MSDEKAEQVFATIRWQATDGQPHCPHCGCLTVYSARRPNGAPRWRCKACRKDFSLTSGTLFASHKLPMRDYLLAIAIVADEVKGKSMLALSRDLDVQYRTAFVLAHKIREATAAELHGTRIGGADKKAEVDGAYFGGYVKPENRRADRKDRRLLDNQGKRKVVVVIRERGGKALTGIFPSEAAARTFIRSRIAKDTELYADEAGGWNDLHGSYTVHRINHQESYSMPGGVHTNNAESYFSRLRRGEYGHHHHIAGPYLARYAQEAAWRENHRRDSNGEQVDCLIALAMALPPSVDWTGYWQRHLRTP
jgi:transposase-like protein